MHVVADLCVTPLGVGASLSEHVAACVHILREAGLRPSTHAYGTNVEGEWDEVFGALARCHQALHAMGAPRVSTSIRCGTRADCDDSIERKVESVRDKLEEIREGGP